MSRAATTLSFLPPWRPVPAPFYIVVRARDVAAFIARYGEHIDGDRIFIFTRVPPPAGTLVRFHIYLATGDCVLRGEGTVLRAVPAGPTEAGGMELRFVAADEASRALVSSLPAAVARVGRRGASDGAGVSRRRFDATE